MNSKAIVSGAVILFVGNLLSSILGLAREVLLAAHYGAGVDMDSYLFANTVPSIFLAFVSGILLSGFVPLYIKQHVEQGPEEASKMYSNTLNWLILIVLSITVMCYALSSYLSAFFTVDPQTRVTIEHLLWILLPGMLFFSVSYAQSLVLNSLNHFTMPAFLTVLNNIVVIAFMIGLHRYLGIYSVAYGFVAGTFLQVLIQLPVLVKKKIRYRLYLGYRETYLKKLMAMALPIVSLVVIDQCVYVATRAFSVYLDAGSISYLNYAGRIIMVPVTLFGTALVSATYPSTVQMLAERKQRDYNAIITTSIKSLVLILTPITVLSLLYASNIVEMLLQRGEFDVEATRKTSYVFLILTIEIVLIPLRDFFTRLFFGRENRKAPIFSSVLYLAAFIAGCLLLVPRMKYMGIAVSSSFALLVSFLYLAAQYKRVNPDSVVGVPFTFFVKIAVSSGAASTMSFLFYRGCQNWFPAGGHNMWQTIVALGIGLLLYIATIKLWKIEEIDFVYVKLSAKFQGMRKRTLAANKN